MRPNKIKNIERESAPAEAKAAVADQVYIDHLRARLAPVVDHAIQITRGQAAQAAAAATHARGWAAPRLGAAVERGRLAASPRVEAASERFAPHVDAARDRIVEDLLPRLMEAVQHVAIAGAAAKAAATDSVSRTVEEAARSLADATPSAKARIRRRRSRALWLSLGAALLSAGATAVWRQAKARQVAAWEVPVTGVPSVGTSTASGPTASAPPVDEQLVDEQTEQLVDEAVETPQKPAPPVDPVAPRGSAPSTGVDAEPSSGSSDSPPDQGGQAFGPESADPATDLGEAPAEPRGRHD